MKIGFFISSSTVGGEYHQTLGLTNTIKKVLKKNDEIVLITDNKKNFDLLNSKENKIYLFKRTFLDKIFFKVTGFINKFFFLKKKLKNPFEIFLDKHQINLLIFASPTFYSLYCHHVDFVISFWNTDIEKVKHYKEFKDRAYSYQKKILDFAVRKSFRIYVTTQTSIKDMVKYFKCKRKKLLIQNLTPYLPLLYNMNKNKNYKTFFYKLNLDKKMKWYYYPAGFWTHKNHDYILRALKILNEIKKDNKVGFIFTGADKGNLQEIKKLSSKYNLNHQIKFFNYLSDEQIISIYKYSSGIVIPTSIGRSSLPFLEALFFNKKIFYSKNILDPEYEKFTKTFNLKKPNELAILLKKGQNYKNKSSRKIYNKLCNDTKKVDNYLKVINDYKKNNFKKSLNI